MRKIVQKTKQTQKMTKNELFYHKGSFYTIPPTKHETRESQMDRVMYIFKNIENGKSFSELKRLSLVWSNMKKLECGYSDKLMSNVSN